MAIYHLSGQVIGRSDGRSVVNAAAYRAGEALYDRRLDRKFDYSRKRDVEESVILGPAHAATWMFDRERLWNAVEQAERRTNSQLGREFNIAIPVELARKNPKAAKKIVRRWGVDMFVSQGLMIDISFHSMESHNPHAHIIVTMRRVHAHAAEFPDGSRHAFEARKAREFDDRGYMDFWRECWADMANEALASEGIDARIDHRTLLEQGIIDREPGIHVGPNASAMAARGLDADRWTKNAIIWFVNEEPYWEDNRAYLAWAEEEAAARATPQTPEQTHEAEGIALVPIANVPDVPATAAQSEENHGVEIDQVIRDDFGMRDAGLVPEPQMPGGSVAPVENAPNVPCPAWAEDRVAPADDANRQAAEAATVMTHEEMVGRFAGEERVWDDNQACFGWTEEIEGRGNPDSQLGHAGREDEGTAAPAGPAPAEDLQRAIEVAALSRPSLLEDAIAWFVAEEDFWRANREMLPWLEERERELHRLEAEKAKEREELSREVAAAQAIIARTPQLKELSQQLAESLAKSMSTKFAEVAATASKLQASALNFDQKTKELEALNARLQGSAPRLATMNEQLVRIGDRLDAAIAEDIARRGELLADTEQRLEQARATFMQMARERARAVGRRISSGLGQSINAARVGAGRFLIAAVEPFMRAVGEFRATTHSQEIGREPRRSISEGEPAPAIPDPAPMSDTELQNARYSDALRLLMYLERSECRAKVTLSDRGWCVEPATVASEYRELLDRVGDHPLITDYVDGRRRAAVSSFRELLDGDTPVVLRAKNRFKIIEAELPEWLREPAQMLLDHDLGFQMFAGQALRRWSGAEPVAELGPRTAGDRPLPERRRVATTQPQLRSSEQPSWHEQLVARRRRGQEID